MQFHKSEAYNLDVYPYIYNSYFHKNIVYLLKSQNKNTFHVQVQIKNQCHVKKY